MSAMPGEKAVIDRERLNDLISILNRQGYTVIGPTMGEGAILYDVVTGIGDLPAGWGDEEEGGRYRPVRRSDQALFGYSKPAQGLKGHLHPARQRLFAAERAGNGFRVLKDEGKAPRYAFLGARACELAAMRVQDKVFDNGAYRDPHYFAKRDDAFIALVTCAQAGGTCFCASMNSGPDATEGFDLKLAELGSTFLIEAGSERGAAILAQLSPRPATDADRQAGVAQIAKARQQSRSMVEGVGPMMAARLEHPHWDEVAKRCMTCGNCTMVCPTCFCTTVEDVTDLAGNNAERWRKWDSCFSVDYSYIHGGAVRSQGAARYRQWITHKLSHWVSQFGVSGCVGCGRCITWCPVGIDITAEAKALGG
ncbi:MAG: 4Fe-4S dicluster domain-containing protein [Rhodospirillales bacterium]|nr:4Fe-4S dicluster domain-containing protein [Rhodospirillales bacterium]